MAVGDAETFRGRYDYPIKNTISLHPVITTTLTQRHKKLASHTSHRNLDEY
jgi:hypothetical protein